MKRQGAVILVTLFAAGQAIAQPVTNAPPASATITAQKPEWHWFAPAATTRPKANPRPVEGLDPRAWTTIVGWHPGESAFASAENHEPGWPLLTVTF